MTNTRFTPGPWVAEWGSASGERTDFAIGPQDEETGRMWCSIFEGDATHGPDVGDPEADLALLGAAWDLYEALSFLLHRVERKHSQNAGLCVHDDFLGQVEADTRIERAREALAKARGVRNPPEEGGVGP